MRSVSQTLLLLVILSGSMVAQVGQTASYFLNYNGGLSYRMLISEDGLFHPLNEIEKPLLVHGAEFQLDIPLGKRLGILSGVGFISFGEKVSMKFHSLNFPDDIDPYYGFVYETAEEWAFQDYTSFYRYNYLTLPVLLRWSVVQKRHSALNIRAGFTANLHLYSRQRTAVSNTEGELEWSSNKLDLPLRKLVPGSSLGLIYKVDLNENLILNVGPQIDIFLTSMSNQETPRRIPYRLALTLGIGI